jgi:hypothetical protein
LDQIGAESACGRAATSKPAKAAGSFGLAAAIWQWLRRMLLRQELQEASAAPPTEEWLERSPAGAEVEAAYQIVAEATVDKTVPDSWPPAIIDEPANSPVHANGNPARRAAGIEPARVCLEDVERRSRIESLSVSTATGSLESQVPVEALAAAAAQPRAACAPSTKPVDEIAEMASSPLSPAPPCLPLAQHRSPAGFQNSSTHGSTECLAEDQETEEPAVAVLNNPAAAIMVDETSAQALHPLNGVGAADRESYAQADSLALAPDSWTPDPDLASYPARSNSDASPEKLEPRSVTKYRPRLDRRPHEGGVVRTARGERTSLAPTPGALDAELVVMFQPGGWGIELAFLLRRGETMADEIAVRLGPEIYNLYAVSDDLFEPLAIADSAAVLATGVAASSMENPLVRWIRSGRSLHAFAAKVGVAGFVSVSRVVIGLENAVICTDELADSVLRICAAVARELPVEVSGPGIPAGWRCFRGIRPVVAVVPEGCSGLFLALVPLPDATIDLGGGISISRSAWLFGHPPSIRILGTDTLQGDVTIDGRPASCSGAGDWVAAGWNFEGPHTIRYAGLSRTYEISRSPQSWEGWEAHAANGVVLCGALATGRTGRPIFASTAGPIWLVGCVPGEVVQACGRNAAPFAMATPSFEPVWAVPVHAGRGRNCQLPQLIGRAAQPNAVRSMPKTAIRLWCQAIREGARDPKHWQGSDKEVAELWMRYRQAARAMWRRSR